MCFASYYLSCFHTWMLLNQIGGATGNTNRFLHHVTHKSHLYVFLFSLWKIKTLPHWIIHLECSRLSGMDTIFLFQFESSRVPCRIPLCVTLSLFKLENVVVKIQGVGISERSSVFDMLSCKYPFHGYFHFLSACCVGDLFCFKYDLWYVSRWQSLTDCSSYPS